MLSLSGVIMYTNDAPNTRGIILFILSVNIIFPEKNDCPLLFKSDLMLLQTSESKTTCFGRIYPKSSESSVIIIILATFIPTLLKQRAVAARDIIPPFHLHKTNRVLFLPYWSWLSSPHISESKAEVCRRMESCKSFTLEAGHKC